MTETTRGYWVQTPWRSWGVVRGASREEAIHEAEAARAREVARLESQLCTIKTMPFKVECSDDE
jgi:hypothetical protein